ncbi:MAG: hypothetical protein ACJ8F7_20675 [Gemmataceae bacterium]
MPRILPTDLRRKAAILYVVIVLLTLFLVVGIAFVLYAESQATSSRIYREAEMTRDLYPSPEELLGWSVGALTYDADDSFDPKTGLPSTGSTGGVFNAIRGHSLARNEYGWNYNINGPQYPNEQPVQNTTPFNGSGRYHATGQQAVNPYGIDDFNLINMTYYGSDGFTLYPERDKNRNFIGGSNPPYTYADMNNVYLAAMNGSGQLLAQSFWRDPLGQFAINNPNVYTANPNTTPTVGNWFQPNSVNPALKHLSMRPRPGDQLFPSEQNLPLRRIQSMSSNGAIFPAPISLLGQGQGGDVINLPGGTENDSVWIDLGFPVQTLKVTHRKVKPMFAFLILDLDGRINMNVSGNVREAASNQSPFHGSAQGWGRWEINPRLLMANNGQVIQPPMPNPYNNVNAGDIAYLSMFTGSQLTQNLPVARGGRFDRVPLAGPPYNPSQMPDANNSTFASPNSGATQVAINGRPYSKSDWDGSTRVPPPGPAAPGKITLPNSVTTPFPTFPSRYQSVLSNPSPSQGMQFEQSAHPSLFNPFNLNLNNQSQFVNDNLPISDTFPLLTMVNQPTNYLNSLLGNLLYESSTQFYALDPNNTQKAAQLMTPYSMDLDRAGSAPGQADQQVYRLDVTQAHDKRFPAMGPTTFANSINNVLSQNPNNPIPSDMRGPNGPIMDWRSLLADWGRVDLNRPLAPYPPPGTAGTQYTQGEQTLAKQAIDDRVRLAQDIHQRFLLATGAGPYVNGSVVINTQAGTPEYEAQRFLAQLAVNIVDFIDEDDFITPFNWQNPNGQIAASTQLDANGWVFGTEIPRIVVNEVYAQIQNDPKDQFGLGPTAQYQAGGASDPNTKAGNDQKPFQGVNNYTNGKAQSDYKVQFFVELYNPHSTDAAMIDNGAARLQLADQTKQAVYQILIQSWVDTGDNGQGMRAAGNVLGQPSLKQNPPQQNQRISLTVNSFDTDGNPPPGQVPPPPPPTQANNNDQQTYLVLPADPNNPYKGTSNGNQGYYVIGPSKQQQSWQADFPYEHAGMAQAPFTPTCASKSDQLTTAIDKAMNFGQQNGHHDLSNLNTTVVLQRLATPLMPANNNGQNWNYNPFVTVDYVDGVQINDSILYDSNGPCDGQMGRVKRLGLHGGNAQKDTDTRFSYGRRQPFRAIGLTQQDPIQAPQPVQPQNTMFQQNGENAQPTPNDKQLDAPFMWLVHLDRKLISPMEILNVSMYKPHELTQQFVNIAQAKSPQANNDPANFNHLAPWFDYDYQGQPITSQGQPATTRLYRCMEMLGCRDNTAGLAFGGRVMGKVNINSIWDLETFQAVCDAQSGNYFDSNLVQQLWTNNQKTGILDQRSQGAITINGQQVTAPDPQNQKDQPFWSLGIPNAGTQALDPQYPYNNNQPARALNRGLLTDSNKNQPSSMLLNVPAGGANQVPTHPYVQRELLDKVFSHFTTRSNTFAVFVTTGFFHVRDDSDKTRPPLLGGEVDPSLRHKFFAVVDRTNLTLNVNQMNPSDNNPRVQGPRPIFFPFAPMNGQGPATFADAGGVTALVPWSPTWAPNNGIGPNGGFLIRDTVDHYGQPFGLTSGDSFEIIPNKTYLNVGVGIDSEAVLVTNAAPTMVNGVQTLQIQFQATKRHAAGSAVCTQLLGNPGPQALPINYEQSANQYGQSGHNAVVPYRVILQ